MRRAKLLSLQIEQTGTSIVSRRRAMFVSTLFQRSCSILSPDLWGAVATEYESDLRALRYVTGDFVTLAADGLAGWRGTLVPCAGRTDRPSTFRSTASSSVS